MAPQYTEGPDAAPAKSEAHSHSGECGDAHGHEHPHGGDDACCGHSHAEEDWRKLAALATGCAVFGGLGAWIVPLGAPPWSATACYALAMLCGAWDALMDSIEDVPHGKVDIHFLMLLVAVGAAVIGAWGEGVLLLFLFSAAGALEAFAMHRTRRAISSLFKDQPKTATLLGADGAEQTVPVESVLPGDLLFVHAGDVFPVDGEVEYGETAADESSLTGESLPAAKQPGDAVFGGTLNLWGAVRVRVRRRVSESSLQKIIRLIEDAQARKAPSQRFTDKFGTRYTLLILGVTVAMFFVWWLGYALPPFINTPEVNSAFYRAMTLLVVASPCALVLSIPSAILAAIAWGARHGVLFRGGSAIEKLAGVDYVALDKTGTLTTGELAVDRVESFPAGGEKEVLRVAAALEAGANHPVARAIVLHGNREGAADGTGAVEQFENVAGFGVKGVVGGVSCALGRREFIERERGRDGTGGAWPAELPEASPEHTEVWLDGGAWLGRILLRDHVRNESVAVLAELKRLGLRTLMLTGDRHSTAQEVGEKLGVQEIAAELTPAEKVARIRDLGEQGHRVAMVGDGVNDAPSLAAAHVAVGMGAHGADAAIEQCDVVLMKDRLDRFLDARNLSVRARTIIRQNLTISLGTILVMVIASVGVGVPLSLGVFAHEGSTVLVCLNSLRLLFGRNPPVPSPK
ncbi:MAG: heavy metal translocating P-type ATPase [Puniceicoccales bacterium]|jgi:Cd2+/Zn2+-exporting ATPase|nr:heavy metal translocating P-type ATPase [Puniceicoccales bacterium]